MILIGTVIHKIFAMLYWKMLWYMNACCVILIRDELYRKILWCKNTCCYTVATLTDSPILAVNRVVLPDTALYRFILHFKGRYWVMKRDTEFHRSVFGLELNRSQIYSRDFFGLWTAAHFSDSPYPGADLVRWVAGGAVPSSTDKYATRPVHLNMARAHVIGA